MKNKIFLACALALGFTSNALAAPVEKHPSFTDADKNKEYIGITIQAGQRLGGELDNQTDSNDSVDASITNMYLSDEAVSQVQVSWYYAPRKEGEVLFSTSSQEARVRDDDRSVVLSEDIDITYLHFGGRIWFPQKVVKISVSAGIGATHFAPDGDYNSETELSGHLGLGLAYEINEDWHLRGDARVFGTFFNTEKELFCGPEGCLMQVDSDILTQTDLTLGIEYRF
ncbi:outer membrane beta-barrel protein [Catenovulum sp. SM1970]|uniref:outer membrane beta-barrel protein n=1 Tax=Marinifaba aquimaris TaxID=2741323 RepID=UPI0015749AC0|nr:outer membrane beta-barrel protein [Marinifaba aquimaris]NTS77183.1 outer membrane beta-barrel protein [Marinifaba aquimaris]